jgi:hypothetical protein
MTNSRAVDRLFTGWLTFAIILILLTAVQGAAGKYDEDWTIPAHWSLALVAPSLALLTAARANKGKGKWKDREVDVGNYRLAFWTSILVWVGAAGVFVYEVVSSDRAIYDLLPIAGLVLLFVQTFVIRAVSSIVFSNR